VDATSNKDQNGGYESEDDTRAVKPSLGHEGGCRSFILGATDKCKKKIERQKPPMSRLWEPSDSYDRL
jgi:hypothetical protein